MKRKECITPPLHSSQDFSAYPHRIPLQPQHNIQITVRELQLAMLQTEDCILEHTQQIVPYPLAQYDLYWLRQIYIRLWISPLQHY